MPTRYGATFLLVSYMTVCMGSMMPQIELLDVKCGRSMTVYLQFDRPFPGVVYSKGHFYDPQCKYVSQKDPESNKYTFSIPIDGCGTKGKGDPSLKEDMTFENTIIIQNDALIQEVWDSSRKLTCMWSHTIKKSVSASPFKIMEPKKVTIEIDDQSVTTLMEIHRGRTPFSSPATGYVYVGDDASIVIYVQEPSGKLDANVVSCRAKTLRGEVVDLVDETGCVTRPQLISEFTKTREVTGVIADLMLYSYIKGFQIGESPEFTVSCKLKVCKGTCPSPCQKTLNSRVRRQAELGNTTHVEVDLEETVVVVTRSEVEETNFLDIPATLIIIVLSTVIITLTLLACCLTGKIRSLQQQLNIKNKV